MMRNMGRYLVGHQNPKFSTSSPRWPQSPQKIPQEMEGSAKGTLYALARSSGEPAWIMAELLPLNTGQAQVALWSLGASWSHYYNPGVLGPL